MFELAAVPTIGIRARLRRGAAADVAADGSVPQGAGATFYGVAGDAVRGGWQGYGMARA